MANPEHLHKKQVIINTGQKKTEENQLTNENDIQRIKNNQELQTMYTGY